MVVKNGKLLPPSYLATTNLSQQMPKKTDRYGCEHKVCKKESWRRTHHSPTGVDSKAGDG